MTDELEMPTPEEAMVMETRMVVMTMELPKFIWWALDMAEKHSGASTSEAFASRIKMNLLESAKKAQKIADLL
jgi:hypothetical protein